jgi:hypothetical protein
MQTRQKPTAMLDGRTVSDAYGRDGKHKVDTLLGIRSASSLQLCNSSENLMFFAAFFSSFSRSFLRSTSDRERKSIPSSESKSKA